MSHSCLSSSYKTRCDSWIWSRTLSCVEPAVQIGITSHVLSFLARVRQVCRLLMLHPGYFCSASFLSPLSCFLWGVLSHRVFVCPFSISFSFFFISISFSFLMHAIRRNCKCLSLNVIYQSFVERRVVSCLSLGIQLQGSSPTAITCPHT